MRLVSAWEGLAIIAAVVTLSCGDDDGQGSNQNNDNDNDNQTQSTCGDGVLDTGEVCDDGAANSDSTPGACRTDCRAAYCGDSVVDPGEACEGEPGAEDTCEGLGWGTGTLTCREDCTLDTSLCGGWIAVAAGVNHTCGIRPDGVVRCWGRNQYGQLGNGLYDTSAEPVTVTGLGPAESLTAGQYHTCAVLTDGSAWCWGKNQVGQLGDGTTEDSLVPVPVSDLTGAVGLSASQEDDVTCAVDDLGTGYCWGNNSVGQLGNDSGGESAIPVQVPITTPLRKISVGSSYACALAEDGSVYCWGYNYSGRVGRAGDDGANYQPDTVAGISDIVDVAAMAVHSCALDDSGHVWCWGSDGILGYQGLLSQETEDSTHIPNRLESLDDVVAIAGGQVSTCALRANGSVWCWGGPRLGNGTAVESHYPVPAIGLEDATALSGGKRHYCALRADRSLACWGNSDDGELGPWAPWDGDKPVPVAGLAGIQGITASVGHSCAVAGELSAAFCWGSNDAGQLGDGTITSRTTPTGVQNLTHVVSMSAGNGQTCAARFDGTAWCWGDGTHGSLGIGVSDAALVPTQLLSLIDVEAVSCGYGFCCARLYDGTAHCWGLGADGRLGDGTGGTSLWPVPVGAPVSLGTPLNDITALSAGGHHACVVSGGSVWCWGNGSNGQLGNGSTVNEFLPIEVNGLTDVVGVSAAKGRFTCAVRATGEVLCWGANWSGQLGDGTYDQRLTPGAVVGLSGAVAVAAGNAHACALLEDGSVWCWGDGAFGQLGAGTTATEPTPVQFQSLTPAVAVEAGREHTCVLQNSGMVWCSGSNIEGQLGDGTLAGSLVPIAGPTL